MSVNWHNDFAAERAEYISVPHVSDYQKPGMFQGWRAAVPMLLVVAFSGLGIYLFARYVAR